MAIIGRRRKRGLSTTQIIACGFLISMIIGMVLLMLPVSSKDGTFTNPVDALFTATTSVCVTGLTTVSTAEHWSVFGQIVIMILIQFYYCYTSYCFQTHNFKGAPSYKGRI